jgi:hypothetical protein
MRTLVDTAVWSTMRDIPRLSRCSSTRDEVRRIEHIPRWAGTTIPLVLANQVFRREVLGPMKDTDQSPTRRLYAPIASSAATCMFACTVPASVPA